ncbi:MAG TPA: hypothetical protein VGM34_03300 [Chlamydiales bacterium]
MAISPSNRIGLDVHGNPEHYGGGDRKSKDVDLAPRAQPSAIAAAAASRPEAFLAAGAGGGVVKDATSTPTTRFSWSRCASSFSALVAKIYSAVCAFFASIRNTLFSSAAASVDKPLEAAKLASLDMLYEALDKAIQEMAKKDSIQLGTDHTEIYLCWPNNNELRGLQQLEASRAVDLGQKIREYFSSITEEQSKQEFLSKKFTVRITWNKPAEDRGNNIFQYGRDSIVQFSKDSGRYVVATTN